MQSKPGLNVPILFFFFFCACHTACRDLSSLIWDPNPGLLQWKLRILTGPPGKSSPTITGCVHWGRWEGSATSQPWPSQATQLFWASLSPPEFTVRDSRTQGGCEPFNSALHIIKYLLDMG